MKTYPSGKRLLALAVNHIIQHPELWDQKEFHSSCGTKHCVGGWIQIMGGREIIDTLVVFDVADLVGIPLEESRWLCSFTLPLAEIREFAKCFIAGEPCFERDFGFGITALINDERDWAGDPPPLLDVPEGE